MNIRNKKNWKFIKSEDINISLDLFITHFINIYDKTCIKKHKFNFFILNLWIKITLLK